MDVVFFDIDDTLYNQAEPFGYAVRSVLGSVPATDDELFDASRRHSGEVFAAFAAGGHPSVAVYVRRMQATLAEFGVNVSAETARRLQWVYATSSGKAMHLSPAMRQVLETCHAHARVGVISNGREKQQMEKIEILGIDRWVEPGAVFISEALGIAKPDPAIFLHACGTLGTVPERCLYVGDSLTNDVPGANAAGMPVVWFHHRDASPAGTSAPTSSTAPAAPSGSAAAATASFPAPAVPGPGPATEPRPTWTVSTAEELLSLVRRIVV